MQSRYTVIFRQTAEFFAELTHVPEPSVPTLKQTLRIKKKTQTNLI